MSRFTIQDLGFPPSPKLWRASRNGILILLILTTYFLLPTSIHAQSVDLLWQGETYTPPFYKGRTLWSNQSRITLAAIPQSLGNAASLYYKWTKNGTVLGNVSGIGRNTLSFSDSGLSRTQTVKVDIISGDGSVLGSVTAVVAPTSPYLAIYENNPLYGFMFHRETGGTHRLEGGEITFTAFPFFFSALDRVDDMVRYEWRTNVGGPEIRNSVTYRAPDDTVGASEVSVSAKSQDRILQSADGSFLVRFGNQ